LVGKITAKMYDIYFRKIICNHNTESLWIVKKEMEGEYKNKFEYVLLVINLNKQLKFSN
jgi:hypothetical protein